MKMLLIEVEPKGRKGGDRFGIMNLAWTIVTELRTQPRAGTRVSGDAHEARLSTITGYMDALSICRYGAGLHRQTRAGQWQSRRA